MCLPKETPQSSLVIVFRRDPSVAEYQFRSVLFLVKVSRLKPRTDSSRKKHEHAPKVFCSVSWFQLEVQQAKPLLRDWQSLPLFRLHLFPLWLRWNPRRRYADPS